MACRGHPKREAFLSRRFGGDSSVSRLLSLIVRSGRSSTDDLVRPRFLGIYANGASRLPSADSGGTGLKERGWTDQDFDKIEAWAFVLRNEARLAGHEIFDTSTSSVNFVAMPELEMETIEMTPNKAMKRTSLPVTSFCLRRKNHQAAVGRLSRR